MIGICIHDIYIPVNEYEDVPMEVAPRDARELQGARRDQMRCTPRELTVRTQEKLWKTRFLLETHHFEGPC